MRIHSSLLLLGVCAIACAPACAASSDDADSTSEAVDAASVETDFESAGQALHDALLHADEAKEPSVRFAKVDTADADATVEVEVEAQPEDLAASGIDLDPRDLFDVGKAAAEAKKLADWMGGKLHEGACAALKDVVDDRLMHPYFFIGAALSGVALGVLRDHHTDVTSYCKKKK